jgi:phosphohistidine phosphatase
MKKLYLIRHAKSDWSDLGKRDFDRGLNKRGKRSIPLMAEALKERGVMPDLILSSAAKRAKRTAKGLAKEMGYQGEIHFDEALYFTEPEEMMEKVRETDDSIEKLFLIGHNPEMTELVNRLTDTYIDNIPTLGIVALSLSIERWEAFEAHTANMDFFIFPKMFPLK